MRQQIKFIFETLRSHLLNAFGDSVCELVKSNVDSNKEVHENNSAVTNFINQSVQVTEMSSCSVAICQNGDMPIQNRTNPNEGGLHSLSRNLCEYDPTIQVADSSSSQSRTALSLTVKSVAPSTQALQGNSTNPCQMKSDVNIAHQINIVLQKIDSYNSLVS